MADKSALNKASTAHRWMAAIAQKYQSVIEIHGIDMSKAFDTVSREKLLSTMRAIVTEDDIRLVRILLSNTTISVRLGKEVSPDFKSTIGTPQGDSLSLSCSICDLPGISLEGDQSIDSAQANARHGSTTRSDLCR
eukprot:scpid86710/ scgid5936/ 